VLAKRGIFFPGGQVVTRTFPAGTTNQILVGQAYVEYSIPQNLRHGKRTPPIILTHSGITGIIWGTTPDGREGWYDFFVRAGFPVYVVDPPGTGRAGFDVDQYNLVRAGLAPPSTQPSLGHRDSNAWEDENMGPMFGAHGPVDPTCIGNDGRGIPPITCYGWRMPNGPEALKHWLAHALPSGPSPSAVANAAFIELLEKIGPAIWIGWSGGGGLGGRLVQARPQLFKALIGVEPNNNCLFAAETNPPLGGAVHVPALSIHGINQIGRPHEPGRNSRADCEAYYAKINAAGGDATWLSLYDIGIYGNSHMMFWENNNEQIAKVLLDWIRQHVERKPRNK
jgi:pimeloyl-ACP methyl ester carboxylesterase